MVNTRRKQSDKKIPNKMSPTEAFSEKNQTSSEGTSDYWKQKFARYAQKDKERAAIVQASRAQPTFNQSAWRHRPLGELEDSQESVTKGRRRE